MSATQSHGTNNGVKLHLAFELSGRTWKLCFTIGDGQDPRVRDIPANAFDALEYEIAKAKKRFGLPKDTPVVSCYEAGREGFYLHRWLINAGIANIIVDSGSIETYRPKRKRNVKSDGVDGRTLVRLLVRYHNGEPKTWKVVEVPTEEEEQRRHLHRHLVQLKAERLQLANAMLAQLLLVGICAMQINAKFAEKLNEKICPNGKPIPEELKRRLLSDFERWLLVDRQIKDIENERKKRVRDDETPKVDLVRQLLMLKGIGLNGAWLLVFEVLGWRVFSNRKQVGALFGMTPTPYDSGNSRREQGIGKSGNGMVRWMMVELAWSWVRHQPNSELTKWYRRRWDQSPRLRKIGIVAVARRLLISLWRYLERGEIPPGADLVEWRAKLKGEAKQVA